MNLQQRIEAEAETYAGLTIFANINRPLEQNDHEFNEYIATTAFIKGGLFALQMDRWIDVKQELPDVDDEGRSGRVIVCVEYNGLRHVLTGLLINHTWHWEPNKEVKTGAVVAWQPLPSRPNNQKAE